MRSGVCLLTLVVAAGCGGGARVGVPKEPPPALATRCASTGEDVEAKVVWFRASDGTLLDGAALGDGDVAVVLAHESPSDLCPWLPYAKTLAARGFLAFAFDFRGMGSSRNSKSFDDQGRFDRDIEAAAAEVRHLGAKKVFLVGASVGGAAALTAAPSVSPEPAGVISLSGETYLSKTLDTMKQAPRMRAPLLLLVSRHDRYVSVADYQRLMRAVGANDKRLAVYGGRWHGLDFVYDAPFKSKVDALVLSFLREHSVD